MACYKRRVTLGLWPFITECFFYHCAVLYYFNYYIGSEIEHCGPANQEEVQQFCWLPNFHRGDTTSDGIALDMDNICDGLIGM